MSTGGSMTRAAFKKLQLDHLIDVILEARGDPDHAYRRIADQYPTDNVEDYINMDRSELDSMKLTKSTSTDTINISNAMKKRVLSLKGFWQSWGDNTTKLWTTLTVDNFEEYLRTDSGPQSTVPGPTLPSTVPTPPPRPEPDLVARIRSNSEAIFEAWGRPLVNLPTTGTELASVVQEGLSLALPSANVWPPGGVDKPVVDVVREATNSSSTVLSPKLELIRSAILTMKYNGDTEDCTHGPIDALIINPIKDLCLFRGVSVMTNRNGVDSSGDTLKNLLPDVLLWLPSNILAFKGEDKAWGVDIGLAREDLRKKMNVFSDAFFGRVPYQLAYACSGTMVEFLAFVRTDNPQRPTEVQLTRRIDLGTMRGRSLCIRYAINIARILIAMDHEYPEGEVIRLGSTVQTPYSTVVVAGDYVTKKAKRYTGEVIEELYKLIKNSGPIAHLIFPRQHRVSRSVLTVDLQPVGFCGSVPTSIAECKAAASSVMSAMEWLHRNGFVHRDIRPWNIMKAEGEWFLIDLEWANYEDQSMEGYDPALFPPERNTAGFLWTKAADMWQFGKLLQTWNQLDAHGHELVQVLTQSDPSNRLSAREVLEHEFIRHAT